MDISLLRKTSRISAEVLVTFEIPFGNSRHVSLRSLQRRDTVYWYICLVAILDEFLGSISNT